MDYTLGSKNREKSTSKEYDDLSNLITVRYLPFKQRRKHVQISVKEVIIETSSAAIAGVIEIVSFQPLDVIKTRFQVQTSTSQIRYNGLVDCFKKMHKTESWKSFYKGMTPPLIMETPRRALMFVSFEQYKALLSKYMTESPNTVCYIAGAMSGATDALISNPFEIVKVILQTDFGKSKRSIFQLLKQLKNEGGNGVNGFIKGMDAAVCRASGYGFAFFGVYFTFISHTTKQSDSTHELFRKVFAATLAGVVATCLVTPFDVIKSRIQSPQPNPKEVKYKYLVSSLKIVYKESGWRALYLGFIPKVIRLGPGGAILMVVYDAVNTKLHAIHD